MSDSVPIQKPEADKQKVMQHKCQMHGALLICRTKAQCVCVCSKDGQLCAAFSVAHTNGGHVACFTPVVQAGVIKCYSLLLDMSSKLSVMQTVMLAQDR